MPPCPLCLFSYQVFYKRGDRIKLIYALVLKHTDLVGLQKMKICGANRPYLFTLLSSLSLKIPYTCVYGILPALPCYEPMKTLLKAGGCLSSFLRSQRLPAGGRRSASRRRNCRLAFSASVFRSWVLKVRNHAHSRQFCFSLPFCRWTRCSRRSRILR